MVNHEHSYTVSVEWTGNRGTGTSDYRAYGRDSTIDAHGKPGIPASADRVFHGDADRWNPEELLLAALSECHMLSYLHAAAVRDIVVVGYTDDATGTLVTASDGSGHFSEVVLHPVVTVAKESMREPAALAHAPAAEQCFIAASMNFPVRHEPVIVALA